ncbi:MAG: hypothetical protein JNK82_07195 [Myxococcaceae bacterium]|nr:hypothetical protein [Myxococcaceae bacterium]
MLALLLTLQLTAAPGGTLADAEAAYYQMNFKGTLEAVERAKAVKGNSRATTLRLLELEGVTAAQLKQVPRAQEALRRLFLIDPEHKFASSFAPKVNTQILEARGWAKSQGPLQVTAAEPVMRPGAVESVGIVVGANPLGVALAARFHTRAPGGEWSTTGVGLGAGKVTVPTEGPVVEWWAEVLGANDAVLVEIGTEGAALVARAPEPPRVVKQAPVEPTLTPQPPLETAPVAATVEAPGPRYRPGAWVTLLAGLASAGVGTYFGVSSLSARSQLENPMLDGSGLVTGRTQAQAQALNGQMQRDAWLANSLIGVGAALVVVGIVLFIAGS